MEGPNQSRLRRRAAKQMRSISLHSKEEVSPKKVAIVRLQEILCTVDEGAVSKWDDETGPPTQATYRTKRVELITFAAGMASHVMAEA